MQKTKKDRTKDRAFAEQKKRKTKGLSALLLAIGLLLTGCSGTGNGQDGQDETTSGAKAPGQAGTENTVPVSDSGEWTGEGGCFKLEIPNVGSYALKVYMDGETIYTIDGESVEDPDRSNYSDFYTRLRKDGEVVYERKNYANAAIGQNGACLLEQEYTADGNSKYWLIQVGLDGSEQRTTDVTGYIGDSVDIGIRQARDGKVYILLYDGAVVLNEDATLHSRIDFPGELKSYSGALIEDKEGRMYYRAEGGEKLYQFNTESGEVDLAWERPGYQILDGGQDYLFTMTNETGFYGITGEGEPDEAIVIWLECGIPVNRINEIACLPEGRFLMKDYLAGYLYLNPAQPSEIQPKTVLKMASLEAMPNTTISEFNLRSSEYIVQATDYSQNGRLSMDEAIAALNMDMISGNYPDLIDLTNASANYYIDKNLLSDLYPFLDGEADMKREDFLCLEKLEREGKLYFAAPSFIVETAAGLYSRFGDKNGWTLEEYMDIQSQNNCDMMYNVTKENFLYNQASSYAASHIDWETGTCDFETEEFLNILDAASKVRENPEGDDFTPAGKRLQSGMQIAAWMWIDGIESLREMETETGERLSYIGNPTVDGKNGTVITLNYPIAICSKGNQEGAWEYVKFLLKGAADGSYAYGISVRKDKTEEAVEKAVRKAEDRGKNLISDELIEQYYDLIENVSYRGRVPEKVITIVLEEAAPFLAGDKSAEDVARIIQSRVNLLVSEIS